MEDPEAETKKVVNKKKSVVPKKELTKQPSNEAIKAKSDQKKATPAESNNSASDKTEPKAPSATDSEVQNNVQPQTSGTNKRNSVISNNVISNSKKKVPAATKKAEPVRTIYIYTMNAFEPQNQDLSNDPEETEYHWLTDPFYTEISGGYRVQCCLALKRIDGIDYLRINACLLLGHNDDNLTWPFKGKFEIRIINQVNRDQDHVWELVSDNIDRWDRPSREDPYEVDKTKKEHNCPICGVHCNYRYAKYLNNTEFVTLKKLEEGGGGSENPQKMPKLMANDRIYIQIKRL